jgi:hypothetical protein
MGNYLIDPDEEFLYVLISLIYLPPGGLVTFPLTAAVGFSRSLLELHRISNGQQQPHTQNGMSTRQSQFPTGHLDMARMFTTRWPGYLPSHSCSGFL